MAAPQLQRGGLRGFSLVRKAAKGAEIAGFGKTRGPVAMRQAWMGLGDSHIEILGLARLDQEGVQDAVDAMIDSIRLE